MTYHLDHLANLKPQSDKKAKVQNSLSIFSSYSYYGIYQWCDKAILLCIDATALFVFIFKKNEYFTADSTAITSIAMLAMRT